MISNVGLQPFHAMNVFGHAQRLEAAGRDICHLQVGEPGAPPAPAVVAALQRAVSEPQRYTPALGMLPLRHALSNYYRRNHGVAVDPEHLMITTGSSAGFIISFLAAMQPGARLAVTRPGYPAYLNTTSALGFAPVEIPLSAANGWRLSGADIAAAFEREPFAALLFASPANPTGASVSRDGMADIVATCRRLGVRLISDEIYHRLDFSGPSSSALEFGDDAIVINSFSKYYCMTGYRVGWAYFPPDLIDRAIMLQQNLFISAPSLSQLAATVALAEVEHAEAQKAHYLRNRRVVFDRLRDIGLPAREPDGAFYAYVDVSRYTNDSLGFCFELLDEAGVATAPGIDFDRVNGGRYIRLSFAGSTDTVERGLERLAGFLATR